MFHESQIEGFEFPPTGDLPELTITQKTDRARAIIEAMPKLPPIHEGSAVPCYRPATDSVRMPAKRFFSSEEAHYSVLFHELAHSTGHASHLDRKSLMSNSTISSTGDTARQQYAEEELVAEMAASLLNTHAGIVDGELENSASYLKGWADTLRRKMPLRGLPEQRRRARRRPIAYSEGPNGHRQHSGESSRASPPAVRFAIAHPGNINKAYEGLHRLCSENYDALGNFCHADLFTEVVPKMPRELSLEA